jgi:hypothetical protein
MMSASRTLFGDYGSRTTTDDEGKLALIAASYGTFRITEGSMRDFGTGSAIAAAPK